ncbi:hypothetical protein KQI84_18300 [bacterium]|nr:hypothetical protein [bacterium]
MSEEQKTDRVCENCGRWVEENEVLYRVRIEVFAEPEVPNINIFDKSREDLADEWDDLIERLEHMSELEAQEASDQVYENHEFNLCPECRREMHRRLKKHRDIL